MTILNRAAIEERSCECYRAMRADRSPLCIEPKPSGSLWPQLQNTCFDSSAS
jgi:hypothetical protein